MRLDLQVNGRSHSLNVDPGRPLLGVLREELALTGTKYGCGEGACGACTVLVGGQAVHSCVTPVSAALGKPVTTIEGLEQNGRLHPLQQAFVDEGAMQCGYCTPGMVLAGVALLSATPRPSTDEIVRALNGNVCRCGTYPRIVAAVQRAAHGGRPTTEEGV
ncbi:MAG TPA: (2Fe-2S)-binding protein [Gemmatimonadaceae bacterium]|nr:(2Fe-2S)-binding protein [Gemmatimonadaceae bacterium]